MAYELAEMREGILELFYEGQRKRQRRRVALRYPIEDRDYEHIEEEDIQGEPYVRWDEKPGKGPGPLTGACALPLTDLQHRTLVMLSIEPRCAHAIRHMRLSTRQGKELVDALAARKLILPVSGRGKFAQFTRRGLVVAGLAA